MNTESVFIVMEDDYPEGLLFFVCGTFECAIEFIKENFSDPYWAKSESPFVYEYKIGSTKPICWYNRHGEKFEK